LVIPATGANALSVAEYVICTVMMLLRGAYLARAEVAAGSWPRGALSEGRETAGKTLGIVGFGGIGRLVARLAQGLGMNVIASDPLLPADAPVWAQTGVARAEFEDLLAGSDALTIHVPLTPETHHLLDARRIALLRPGAVLVNTARGGVVDETALAAALRAGRLGGAALDVFEHEPLAAGSVLAGVPNLVLTPHVAGVTQESNHRVSSLIAEKVSEALHAQDPRR
jgi:(S)-sulfolactate dehydrogenase